jgi:hypothetical protein
MAMEVKPRKGGSDVYNVEHGSQGLKQKGMKTPVQCDKKPVVTGT